MWAFAIPLFLLELDTSSLALAAVYGLVTCATVLMFGPLVGGWIDKTRRLQAVQISLIIQNSFVILSSVLLLINRVYSKTFAPWVILIKIGSISFGAVSYLASQAMGIIIQKDWIVVVSGKDEELLAEMNSMMRRIDLATKIISPLICGQIMHLFELTGGAVFIVGWNFFSMFVEYFLLKSVYKRVPALASKQAESSEDVEMANLNDESTPSKHLVKDPIMETKNDNENGPDHENKTDKSDNEKETIFQKVFGFIITVKNGWKFYFKQPIALPCFGFSFLYLTVLGFGYITIAYAYNQCFSEFMMSLITAAAAITGIVATYIYPRLRNKVGLIRTGLYSAAVQSITLIPCIAAIFLDGSPFYLLDKKDTKIEDNATEFDTILFRCLDGTSPPSSFLSLSVLMGGVVVARIGLWGFDLTITQLIQESIPEHDRGIFNGVQSSLNSMMDMLTYILVIILPQIEMFGILVLISSVTISSCYIMYCMYAFHVRGHILPHCVKKETLSVAAEDPGDDAVSSSVDSQ